MAHRRWHLLVATALLALAPAGWCQRSFDWRSFKFTDDMPETACNSVFIVPPGRILVGHVNTALATEFDGYSTSTFPAPARVAGRICQSPSGQLWTVVPEGLQELKEGRWVTHPVSEIAGELRSKPSQPDRSLPIYPVKQDRVIFLLHDRLMEFSIEGLDQIRLVELRAAARSNIGDFSEFTVAPDGIMWLAGEHGISKTLAPARSLKPDSEWRDFAIPNSLQIKNLREPLADGAGGVTLLADSADGSRQVVVLFDGQHWTPQPIAADKIQRAWRGEDNTFWAVATDGLFQWENPRPMTTNEDIFSTQFFDVAVEAGGVFWLATSDGLYRHTPPVWRKPVAAREVNSLVVGLSEDAAGRLWFVANNRLHALLDESCRAYPLPPPFRIPPSGRVLFPLKDGTLLLDAGDRLLRFNPDDGSFKPVPSPVAARHPKLLGPLPDGSVCAQVSGGRSRLNSFDGAVFHPLPNPPDGFGPDENITAFFAARGGDRWLGNENGVVWLHETKWRWFEAKDRTAPAPAVCFAELADGKIWCGTPREIWEFDGRDWSLLRAGFDRINSIHQSRDGSVWIASNNGLLRYFQGAWLENGEDDGLPDASVREVCGDARGRVWAATTRGLSVYHPEADSDPPRTFILPLAENLRSIPEGTVVELAFSGKDRWKHTPRHRLIYSYRLDEKEWSPYQDVTTVSFNNLSPGKHFFQARAMDRNGNVDPLPPILEFTVALPWYKETRLVLIALFGMGAALFFAALAVNRHRRLRRSYAEVERKVAERTRELEVAGRELLHSQKMNALGTLAAGVAHDFNNILSIIKGSAQIIEDNLDNPQKIHTRVDRIKTVVEQGSGIVKAMLGFSRNSDGQPAACDPNEVVADTIRLLGDRFLREVEVQFEPAAGLPPVSASKDFLQQILLNFIFNAAEAMSDDKLITLSARRTRAVPAGLALAPAEAAEYICISVRDSGCGIPPENLSRIFEPFFTTKALSTRRGTGLGLSMAYELSKKMEAGLAVESAVGQGSTFTLILPVREAAAEVKA